MEEQITHIIESAQAGVIAVINNGELRRIGWEDLQNIANGNDTTAINNARTAAADALEIEYTADSSGEFKACRVWVGLGGPNICIDTARRAVCLYGWGNSAEYSIDCADEVDEIAPEWWEALRA